MTQSFLPRAKRCLLGIVASLVTAVALAQEQDQKLGEVNFAVACENSAAPVFNKAVALLHSFEYDEARRMFEDVSRRDSQCAMAHWGVAMTYLHPLWAPPTAEAFQAASVAVHTAKQLGTKNPREAGFIEALGRYFNGDRKTSHRKKLRAYRAAMEALSQRYPQDIEVTLFYALLLMATADPQDATYRQLLQAGEMLETFVAGNPNHPGLTHYIIHTYDIPPLAHRALPAARRYAIIAPDSAHARHMPSHIFQRLGMWQDSIRSNLAATASARSFARRANIKGHWDEELHGLDFLANAYMQIGYYDKAREVRDYVLSMKHFYPENFKIAYVLATTPARYELDRQDWRGAADLALNHGDFPWHNFPHQRGITHYAIGYGNARLGDVDAAQKRLEKLREIKAQLEKNDRPQLAHRTHIQMLKISAWAALARDDRKQALRIMRQAADLEWGTVIPTGAILPAYEMLGDMYRKLAMYDEAIAAYERSLSRETNRRNGLTGLIEAAGAVNDAPRVAKYTAVLRDISRELPRDLAEGSRFGASSAVDGG